MMTAPLLRLSSRQGPGVFWADAPRYKFGDQLVNGLTRRVGSPGRYLPEPGMNHDSNRSARAVGKVALNRGFTRELGRKG